MSEHSEHPSYLGHHYETPEQQFASGKLGMWLFLATEILLFAGLFCAYAVYRSFHPEIFQYAHQFLDKELGGINTVILITSSFTMAMAVRTAQLGKRQATIALLSLTLLGGVGFLGIKKVEYESKWKHGLLWGTKYQEQDEHHGEEHGAETGAGEHSDLAIPGVELAQAAEDPHAAGDAAVAGNATPAGADAHAADAAPDAGHGDPASGAGGAAAGVEAADVPIIGGEAIPHTTLATGAEQPQGIVQPVEPGHGEHADKKPSNVHIFFGIYFLMTGLHGIHVIAGMGAIGWVLFRTIRGDFSAEYSTPVDLVGLYWHLVDLIWIYLFPLLYLIH